MIQKKQPSDDDTKTIEFKQINKKLDLLGLEVAAGKDYKHIFDLSNENRNLIVEDQADIKVLKNDTAHIKDDVKDLKEMFRGVNRKMDRFQETVAEIKKEVSSISLAVSAFIRNKSGDLLKVMGSLAVVAGALYWFNMRNTEKATAMIIDAQNQKIEMLIEKNTQNMPADTSNNTGIAEN